MYYRLGENKLKQTTVVSTNYHRLKGNMGKMLDGIIHLSRFRNVDVFWKSPFCHCSYSYLHW
jgi:hypothetical protein